MTNSQVDRRVHFDQGDRCWRGQFIAMAGPCEILCETDDPDEARSLAKVAAQEAWRIEDKFSRYVDTNTIHRINHAGGAPVTVDAETAQLIDFAQTIYEMSEGRFDITSGVLGRVWCFDGSDNLPSSEHVAEVLAKVGWHRATWKAPVLQLPPGMQIDFGGIGKEYAVDCAASLLRERTDHSCLVNFGGDLAVTAAPRNFEHWVVGIEAIGAGRGIPSKLLQLRVGALATSGDARRFLQKNGIRYSHILDPQSGWPVADAPHAVTVAADTCTQAGMLSTLAMLQGREAEAYLGMQEVQYWCSR